MFEVTIQTQPEKICKSLRTNQCHSLRILYCTELCFAISWFSQVVFVTSNNFTHNLLLYSCFECHCRDWDVIHMRLRARTLLSRCGTCDWNWQSYDTVGCEWRPVTNLAQELRLEVFEQNKPWRFCEDRKSWYWRDICDSKMRFFQQTLKRFSEPGLSRYWHEVYLKKSSIALLVPISWLQHSETSNISKAWSFSIAFLAPISWLDTLATSPKLGRLQKNFNRFRVSSWWAFIANFFFSSRWLLVWWKKEFAMNIQQELTLKQFSCATATGRILSTLLKVR